MANQDNVNWVTVLSFLQKQQMHSVMRDKQWGFEKQQLQDKINRLQAQLDSNRIIIQDLLNRIKLLEIALFQSSTKNMKYKPQNLKEQDLEKVENLIEKYKLETKINEDDHNQFLNQIFSQIGVDSSQVTVPSFQRDFIENKYQKQNQLKIKQSGFFNAHLDGIRNIFINNTKDFIVSISQDCLIKLWAFNDAIKNKNQHLDPSRTYREHAGPLFALAGQESPFNSQYSIFFTGGSDGIIKYWKINNKNYLNSAEVVKSWGCSKYKDKDTTVWDLSILNNKLLSSGSEGQLNLYQFSQSDGGILKNQYKQKEFNPTCVQWINEQSFIEGCSNAPRARIWDVNGAIRQKYLYDVPKGGKPEYYQINKIHCNKNLGLFVFGCQDGNLRLFPLNTNKIIRKIQLSSSISSIQKLKDWQVVCGTHNGQIHGFDLRNYQQILKLQKCHSPKYDQGVLCIWANENKMISGGADGIIKIYS